MPDPYIRACRQRRLGGVRWRRRRGRCLGRRDGGWQRGRHGPFCHVPNVPAGRSASRPLCAAISPRCRRLPRCRGHPLRASLRGAHAFLMEACPVGRMTSLALHAHTGFTAERLRAAAAPAAPAAPDAAAGHAPAACPAGVRRPRGLRFLRCSGCVPSLSSFRAWHHPCARVA
jgi:hypothetical protein